jgi:putative hydrolase of the HAD superfamily
MVTHIIFDFDGVIAEPGFRLALAELAPDQGLELAEIARQGMRALLKSGYVTGQGREAQFRAQLQAATGIDVDVAILRAAILRRSTIRQPMIALVDQLRLDGLIVALLSDHTDWLDEIAEANGLVEHFDYFFNSYYLQRSKRDPLVFDQVLELIGAEASQTLFIDDNPANVERAVSRGLQGITYRDFTQLGAELARIDKRLFTHAIS